MFFVYLYCYLPLTCRCKSAYDNRDTWVADPALFIQLNNLAMLIGQLFLVLEVGSPQLSSLFLSSVAEIILMV